MSLTFGISKNVRDGLVLHLDAANPKSYPGTGTLWKDLSGNGNNVTLTNGPTFNSDYGGNIVFDGGNDYANFFAPNLSGTATVEMWVKVKSLFSGTAKMFFGWNRYDVYSPTNGVLGYNTGNSDVYGISAATVTSLSLYNNWKHYVFEMRSDVSYTNNKIYIDTVSQTLSQQQGGEGISNRNFNSGDGRFPGWRINTSYLMNMDIASFKVYNRSLTQEEISQNYSIFEKRITE